MLDLKKYKEEELKKYKEKFLSLDKKCRVLMISFNDEASKIYVRNKIKALDSVGVLYTLEEFDENVLEDELISLINNANKNDDIKGIMIELPMYSHLDKFKIINSIDPKKDIDGITYVNKGLNLCNKSDLVPCTAKGIMRILSLLNCDLSGKNIVVINRSELIGLPLIPLLLKEDASVTILHSKSKNITKITKKADIIITAVGKKNFIKKNMVRRKAIVIDAGITRGDNGICGDVDYKNVAKKAFVTRVPNGVGQMTILEFVNNIYIASLLQNKKD